MKIIEMSEAGRRIAQQLIAVQVDCNARTEAIREEARKSIDQITEKGSQQIAVLWAKLLAEHDLNPDRERDLWGMEGAYLAFGVGFLVETGARAQNDAGELLAKLRGQAGGLGEG